MLYIFENIDKLNDDFPQMVASFLSKQRREKINRLPSLQAKKVSTASYLLLRLALKENYNINEAVEFDFIENGKPVLTRYPEINFNLSHTNNTSACVISDQKIGVDIQQIKAIKDNVAKRVLTGDEYKEFKENSDPEDFFCKIWAIKESYLKLTGQGIAAEFRDITANTINNKTVIKRPDYYICVCCSNDQTIKTKYVRSENFGKLLNR